MTEITNRTAAKNASLSKGMEILIVVLLALMVYWGLHLKPRHAGPPPAQRRAPTTTTDSSVPDFSDEQEELRSDFQERYDTLDQAIVEGNIFPIVSTWASDYFYTTLLGENFSNQEVMDALETWFKQKPDDPSATNDFLDMLTGDRFHTFDAGPKTVEKDMPNNINVVTSGTPIYRHPTLAPETGREQKTTVETVDVGILGWSATVKALRTAKRDPVIIEFRDEWKKEDGVWKLSRQVEVGEIRKPTSNVGEANDPHEKGQATEPVLKKKHQAAKPTTTREEAPVETTQPEEETQTENQPPQDTESTVQKETPDTTPDAAPDTSDTTDKASDDNSTTTDGETEP